MLKRSKTIQFIDSKEDKNFEKNTNLNDQVKSKSLEFTDDSQQDRKISDDSTSNERKVSYEESTCDSQNFKDNKYKKKQSCDSNINIRIKESVKRMSTNYKSTTNIQNQKSDEPEIPNQIIQDKVKHKLNIKAVIFDQDKTLSECDVYEDDWDKESYPKLFFGSNERLKRLKKFLSNLKNQKIDLQIASQNLQKNISQSLVLANLEKYFEKEKIQTRLDFDQHCKNFNSNQKMNLINNEILIPNKLNKWNVLFLDDKLENLKEVEDQLIPVHVNTRGINENLMNKIESKVSKSSIR